MAEEEHSPEKYCLKIFENYETFHNDFNILMEDSFL